MKRRKFLSLIPATTFPFLFTNTWASFFNGIKAHAADNPKDLTLWYTRPATQWLEALPLGNGRIGAMVSGGITEERIMLNESTLYAEEPGSDVPIDISEGYDAVINMIREGLYAEAADYITKHWTGRCAPCYQPLGDLRVRFDDHSTASAYVRELNLPEAVSKVSYQQNGIGFEREAFVSNPDDALIIRFRSDKPGSLSFNISFDSQHPVKVKTKDESEIVFTGQLPGIALRRTLEYVEERNEQWKYPEIWNKNGTRKSYAKQILYGEEAGNRGMYFEVRIRILSCDGIRTDGDNHLGIKDAQEAVLAVAASSSFNGPDKSSGRQGVDPASRTIQVLQKITGKSYDQLRQAHVADFQALFNRVAFRLEGQKEATGHLSTEERLTRYSAEADPFFAALYFQYGRYLLISSSRRGGQAANLQGLWNVDRLPPWGGAYTTNINLQMNYWGAEAANLSECHEPLFELIRETAAAGKTVAEKMYHRPGWVMHHNTSIWRDAQPIDVEAYISFWPMAGGWLCQHLWEHYLFTLDKQFLRDTAYDLMKGAALFYDSWLEEDEDGYLVTPISTSPENMFFYTDAHGEQKSGGVSKGSTLDMAIIRELFHNTIEAGKLLETDEAWRQKLAARLQKLRPYKIGSRGQLLEYFKEFKEVPPRHNTSPFYPLYPGSQFTLRKTPELVLAEQKLLEERKRDSGGWPAAWLASCWARLHKSDTAHRYLEQLIRGSHVNLFNGHNTIFQVDGNLGGIAAVVEMLLQSHDQEIELLPALPVEWASGAVKGLRARGSFEVDITWKDGRLANVALKSIAGTFCKVRYGGKVLELKFQPGQVRMLDAALVLT